MKFDRKIAADVLEQQRFASRRSVTIGHRRKLLDVDLDQAQRILGNAGTLREHERERLADVAHLRFRDHRLAERLEIRQRLQPHRHARHPIADVLRGDHAVYARQCQRRGHIEGADAAMGDGTAQDCRVQQALAAEIVDVLPAPAQKAQVLDPFDRTADERIDRSHGRSVARTFGL